MLFACRKSGFSEERQTIFDNKSDFFFFISFVHFKVYCHPVLSKVSLSHPTKMILSVPRRCFFCGSFLIFMFRFCHAVLSCGNLLGKGWPLGSLVCDVFLVFDTFPCGVLGQVWYLIVPSPDICLLPYFKAQLINQTAAFVRLSFLSVPIVVSSWYPTSISSRESRIFLLFVLIVGRYSYM